MAHLAAIRKIQTVKIQYLKLCVSLSFVDELEYSERTKEKFIWRELISGRWTSRFEGKLSNLIKWETRNVQSHSFGYMSHHQTHQFIVNGSAARVARWEGNYLVVPLRSDQPSGISRWEPYLVWLSLNVSRGFSLPLLFYFLVSFVFIEILLKFPIFGILSFFSFLVFYWTSYLKFIKNFTSPSTAQGSLGDIVQRLKLSELFLTS